MSTLLYNPDRKDRQDLINEFVVRTEVFTEIFDDIKSGKMKYPEQNYLLIGQRGSGKTTLITRLKYAIQDDPALHEWLIPIVFSEEQYNISELANVWENICIYLEDYYGFEGITDEISRYNLESEFESKAYNVLTKHLEKKRKRIVLFVDNIGDLLKKFSDLDVLRLREILQSQPYLRLIGGSSIALESLVDYHQPLYEFFKVIHLKGLSYEETITLLRKLAESHNQKERIEAIINKSPSRIETLRSLSGGVPRTMALLFNVFLDNEHGNSINDLEKVLDEVTPLYKHRMDDLAAQQQKIVDAVAKKWDAITVKELTEQLRIESKAISAQLKQLERNQVIEKRTTETKNHIYLIRERFFNIWYLMRYGRKHDRERVIWLVKFLEMWCDGKEIENRIINYIEKAKNGLLDTKSLEFYGEAYSFFEKVDPGAKLLLKENTPNYISKNISVDFDYVIDKYIKEKEWQKLIDVSVPISRKDFTYIQKQKIYNLLANEKTANKFTKLFISNFKNENGISKSGDDLFVSYFYLGGFLQLSAMSTVNAMRGDENKLKENFERTQRIYNGLIDGEGDDEFEQYIVEVMIIAMLVNEYHNLALSFYENQMASNKLREKQKPLYITTLYLAKNEDSSTLNQYGSELKETVMNMVKIIKDTRKRLYNKRKKNESYN